MLTVNLEGVDISKIVRFAFFQTLNVKPEVLELAKEGIDEFETAVRLLIENRFSRDALRLDDLAILMGTNGRTLSKHITAAQKVAHDKYDGKFDPPGFMNPQVQLYQITSLALTEIGRVSKDIDVYTVLTFINRFFKVGEKPGDIACYTFMCDYFITCLRQGFISITKFAKTDNTVTAGRLSTWLQNQAYNNKTEFRKLFGPYSIEPTLGAVSNFGYKYFNELKYAISDRNI